MSGALLSQDALARVIPRALHGHLGEEGRSDALRALRARYRLVQTQLGPSASARTVFDRVGLPLATMLGYRVLPLPSSNACFKAVLEAGGTASAVLLVTPWGRDLSTTWREAVTQGIGHDLRWCMCLSGPALRIADSERTYSRRFIEIDLLAAVEHDATFGVLWGLLRGDALLAPAGQRPVLERAVAISEQHREAVRGSLQSGVEEALTMLGRAFVAAAARKRAPSSAAGPASAVPDEALVVIYRVLFLLFAEARGLVPQWHPVYRDSYTIESLREAVEQRPRPPGLWEALQAISRLAHRGCRAGALRVPPFNGRLFSPAHAPLADTLPLDDAAVRAAVLALTTREGPEGRERIAYGDLGVEQLGGVYERLLDFDIDARATPRARVRAPRRERRKATGSFYTPRSLTEYLIRRTLAPLVKEATPEQILRLRIVDPAMGSGAFLVAACRYLAAAYELALVREMGITDGDVSDAERAEFRRAVARQCLFGVDVNPMAVQLGRLSLWLATLAADRPLTFLDHRLRSGDSLIGAAPSDVLRQPPPGRSRARPAPLPLLEADGLGGALEAAIAVRDALATGPGDTLEQVRAKERALAGLEGEDSTLTRWRRVADLWCSGWFQDSTARVQLRTAFHALTDAVLTGRTSLPDSLSTRLLTHAGEVAATRRFFHWPLEFPEVFHDAAGRALPAGGFDAVVGNPPWEMLRGDYGGEQARRDARLAGGRVSEFARSAGIYRLQGDGHVNLYQLFLERALTLLRSGGRLGLILPSGLATDHGCASLREALLDRTRIDTLYGFENRDALFPIHRGLKFLLLAASSGAETTELPARFGLRRPEILDELPDTGRDPRAVPLTRAFIARFSGPQLVVPEIRAAQDLRIASRIAFDVPPLGHPDGWHVTFGRELNATDDRPHFVEHGPGLPVIDGKHIRPFGVDTSGARFRVPLRVAERLASARAARVRPRLAYRDVASPANRLTLIAAIVPAGVLTTHTLFCLREAIDQEAQAFLCGLLNSYVANYLVRLQVGTHVTASLMARLQVPKPPRSHPAFSAVMASAHALRDAPADIGAAARLQAWAARLYGLDASDLAHVLAGFPLVSRAERNGVVEAFRELEA